MAKGAEETFGFDNLTKAEQELIRCAPLGIEANVRGYADDQRSVRKELIRAIAIRLATGEMKPHGPLWLFGAVIEGVLDLSDIDIAVPLYLQRCNIGGLNFRAACKHVDLHLSDIGRIDAQGCGVRGDWSMDRATVRGEFRIAGAVLEGQFSANDSTFDNPEGDAVIAEGIKAAGWFMDRATVKGEFNIDGAVLEGPFTAKDTTFNNPDGDALLADGIKAAGWYMSRATVNGKFRIAGAVLEGQFTANDATFNNPDGDALLAQGIKAAGWFGPGGGQGRVQHQQRRAGGAIQRQRSVVRQSTRRRFAGARH